MGKIISCKVNLMSDILKLFKKVNLNIRSFFKHLWAYTFRIGLYFIIQLFDKYNTHSSRKILTKVGSDQLCIIQQNDITKSLLYTTLRYKLHLCII